MFEPFTCPRCGMESHHPMDALEGYCGNCHDWTRQDPLDPYRPRYYDYDGNRITMHEWSELWGARHHEPDMVRWRVGLTRVGDYEVSTVWLGLDHSYRFLDAEEETAPLIFETMVFYRGQGEGKPIPELDDYQQRYSTKEQAAAGHEATVAIVSALVGAAAGGSAGSAGSADTNGG